jgi:alkylated DNA repair dioxygenase AlkB
MQKPFDLFSKEDELISLKIEDGQLCYFPNAIHTVDADAYLSQCIDELPWRQDSIRIAGKIISIPRLQNWFGDQGMSYSYSGIAFAPLPWPDFMLAIKDRVEKISQHRFNSVLANYYRNGSDSVDWHSDDESELGANPIIASVSLGATRVFSLRHRYNKSLPQVKLSLLNGSVLVMSGATQSHWQHRVAKQPNVAAPRVNLTFRQIKALR